MNPCALAFTPSSPETEPNINDEERPGRRLARPPTCPRSWRRKENVRSPKREALDPNNYDTMFPSLSSSNPSPNSSSSPSRQTMDRRNRRRRQARKPCTQNGGASNLPTVQGSDASGPTASGNAEETTEPFSVVEKNNSELISPDLPDAETHTPPPSSRLQPQQPCGGPKPPSPPPPFASKPETLELVRVTPHMPPTPKPDHEVPMHGDSALVTYSVGSKPTQCISSQNIAPQSIVPQSTVPQCLPPPGFSPQGFPPQNIAPENIIPQSIAPQNCVPQNFASRGIVSQNVGPQNIASENMMPQNMIPQNMIPQNMIPQNIMPQNIGFPQPLMVPQQPQYYPNVMTPTIRPAVPVCSCPTPGMPYVTVYMTPPPVVWQPTTPQPGLVWPAPPDQYPAHWPQPLQSMSVPVPQLPQRVRSRSRSKASDSRKGPRTSNQTRRRVDNRRQPVTGQLRIPRPGSTPGHKSQVEVLRSTHQAKSSSPSRLAPDHQVIGNPEDQVQDQSREVLTGTNPQVAEGSKEPSGAVSNEQTFRRHVRNEFDSEEVFKMTSTPGSGRTRRGGQGKSDVVEVRKTSDVEIAVSSDQSSHAVTHIARPPPLVTVNGPPTNAPKAPASQRRLNQAAVALPQPLVGSPAESGGWSQSKRWMSQETKERAAFQKMLINLHYMGADKSPFVPQNPAELTAFKLEAAESEKKRLIQKMDKRIAKIDSRNGNKSPLLCKLLGGKLRDKLSPVFFAIHCFNKELPSQDEFRVDWPSLAELKEEGDKRASRYGRYFPLPRLNVVAARFSSEDRDKAYSPDGTIRWEKKTIKLGAREIMPVTAEYEAYTIAPVSELQQEDLPVPLQLIIKHIDGDQENPSVPQEKEKSQKDE
ncbi:hypothetical protein B0J13DRAFT_223644 [Dactylonectria estremocensis]|uniref:Uncharacterized protein n=1 Tax=Dactylonectria estremocensis TaxID=1079267 RepID=A0A9P9F5U9_9HYPO|nr:hypothetical protein B0J13DRAFT_223644 [Dactylonectria estremocensis]